MTGNIQVTAANAGPSATWPTGIGGKAQAWQFLVSGAAWADCFNGDMELSGRPYDGGLSGYQTNNKPTQGPCGINCNNERTKDGNGAGDGAGLYSWHTGGRPCRHV